ncbi:MAG TPA: Fe-S protein assembly co-chaperone HscB [Bryobacteraceae bacterium]
MRDVVLGVMAPDYFQIFDLPRKLSIDAFHLEQRFYELSRKLHPDRFLRATAAERERSLEASALLNDAYRTLRNPVARAEHLLKLEGREADGSAQAPPELLAEVFELNEALEEVRDGREAARPGLERDWQRFLVLLGEADAHLDSLSRRYDSGEPGALEQIRTVLMRRRYLANLLAQVDRVLVP